MFKQDCIDYLSILKKQVDALPQQSQKPIELGKIIDSLKVNPGEHNRSYVPEYFDLQLKQMDAQTTNLIQKTVILKCMLNNWDAIFNGQYPDTIVAQYNKAFKRLLVTCQTEAGWCKKGNDYYWKDLSMAQQLLFPAGVQLLENSSGFGLKQGLNQGWKQSLRFLWLSLCQGGRKGYYQMHMHTPELSEFNPEGFINCYLRIVQMLELNPKIKGVFCNGWLCDPQLKDISPELMYVQEVPLKHGASSFLIGEDKSGNAIFESGPRLKLQDSGKYTPQNYLLIWPCSAFLKWANHYKTDL
jgi:hypothetical protein